MLHTMKALNALQKLTLTLNHYTKFKGTVFFSPEKFTAHSLTHFLRILFFFPFLGKGKFYKPPAFFFFPVKIKSARESFFWPFFDFFHGWKMAFTHTFFEFFTGDRKFSRTFFRIFSRVGFFFHGKEMRNYR